MIVESFIVLALLTGSSMVSAEAKIVPMFAQEGLQRLERSEYKADFGKLISHYRNQNDRMSCGPVAGAIVLNALRYNTDKAPLVELPRKEFLAQMPEGKDGKQFDPRLHLYTPENFMNDKATKLKSWSRLYAEPTGKEKQRDPGISLEQLRAIFADAHGTTVTKINVGKKETANTVEKPGNLSKEEYENVIAEMKKNLKEENNYIIVNFSRGILGQPGTGHLSPVAAYDEKSDSFLVLDVNPFGGPMAWIDAKHLVAAMNTTDSDENRGLLLISE